MYVLQHLGLDGLGLQMRCFQQSCLNMYSHLDLGIIKGSRLGVDVLGDGIRDN
jgi:hypothetical protein